MSIDRSPDARTWAWIAALAMASLALSRAFACAMPFAALAALAAFIPQRRAALALVATAWAGNQVIGFAFLHYPCSAETFGWGASIGAAALAAYAMAAAVTRLRGPAALRLTGALLAAFAVYEGVLLGATAILPSGAGAFAPATVVRIFAINAVAFGLLLAANRLARSVGLVQGREFALHG